MNNRKLPAIREGILNPEDGLKNKNLSPEIIDRLDMLYAKDYKVCNDMNIIYTGFKELGRISNWIKQAGSQRSAILSWFSISTQ